LGNIREVIDEKGDIVQITNYYPFGTPFAEEAGNTNPDLQNHKYNGKELDTMYGMNTYDHGARQYNSLFGRWDRMDPLCEKYYSVSPHAYCANNPVMLVDPDGMDDYYDSYGTYLGTNKAETDYIYIAKDFRPLKDGGYEVQINTRVALPDAKLSAEAWSKILTCSVNWMSDVDISKLDGGQITVVLWPSDSGNGIYIDDTHGNYDYNRGIDRDTNAEVNGNNIIAYIHAGNKKLFETRSNIQNMLGVHEYRNHFINQLHHSSTEDNIKLFNDVMSDPTWKKTTEYYKENEIIYRNYFLK